jgi:hypothetical protein
MLPQQVLLQAQLKCPCQEYGPAHPSFVETKVPIAVGDSGPSGAILIGDIRVSRTRHHGDPAAGDVVRQPDSVTIGQLARKHGLSRSTLLYYDRIGLLSPTSRSAAGYRRYGPTEVDRLTRICE